MLGGVLRAHLGERHPVPSRARNPRIRGEKTRNPRGSRRGGFVLSAQLRGSQRARNGSAFGAACERLRGTLCGTGWLARAVLERRMLANPDGSATKAGTLSRILAVPARRGGPSEVQLALRSPSEAACSRSGTRRVLGKTKHGHLVVEVESVTGFNNNRGAGFMNQPTHIFMIKGTSRPSVVPTTPTWTPHGTR